MNFHLNASTLSLSLENIIVLDKITKYMSCYKITNEQMTSKAAHFKH